MTRPKNYTAGNWSGQTWEVDSTQTGRGKPTTHSKRLKAKRKASRRGRD